MLDPGSEGHRHRLWFEQSAKVLFHHLTEPWQDISSASFEILLYDLTSPCF